MKKAPADVFDALTTRWRASLPVRYPVEAVDDFLVRNRPQLVALVTSTLVARYAELGEPPETAAEFAAYDPIVARERSSSAAPHGRILSRLMKRIDRELAGGYRQQLVINNLGLEYVDTHTEAILGMPCPFCWRFPCWQWSPAGPWSRYKTRWVASGSIQPVGERSTTSMATSTAPRSRL